MNQNEQELGRRKMHWSTYTMPVIGHVLIIALLFYFMNLSSESPKFAVLSMPLAILVLAVLSRLIYIILYTREFTFIITNQRVRTEWGLLPWQKKMTYLTLDNIFEAYARQGINEKMFNYGNITLIKKDGLRSEYVLRFIPDPLNFLALINREKEQPSYRQVIEAHPVLQPIVLPVPGQSASSAFQITEQLEKLIQLKKDGNLTEEEFEKLKSKLIQAI